MDKDKPHGYRIYFPVPETQSRVSVHYFDNTEKDYNFWHIYVRSIIYKRDLEDGMIVKDIILAENDKMIYIERRVFLRDTTLEIILGAMFKLKPEWNGFSQRIEVTHTD